MKKVPYRVLESRSLYRGHHIELVKDRFVFHALPSKIVTRELIRHPGAVVVLPFIHRDRILLLKQFRYSAQGNFWEIPAGTIEGKEKPIHCAKRELEEETGYAARRWRFLTRFFPAPGISNEVMFVFMAWDLKPGRKNLDHDEWIEHKKVSIKTVLDMMKNGRIRDAKTIAAVLWVREFGLLP